MIIKRLVSTAASDDKHFRKTQQLLKNPNVAMCWNGVQIEGIATNKGLVIDEDGRIFEAKYKQHLWGSYNAYSHIDIIQ